MLTMLILANIETNYGYYADKLESSDVLVCINDVLLCLHPIVCVANRVMWTKIQALQYDRSNNHCVCSLQIKEMKYSLVKMLVSNVLHCYIK